ncbi:MAG: tetratricopeptide repeat protein [Armatimonadetes bacterium]|nr:tetratricopeptide repeat protein [Armatimonadota bacterium]
MAASAKESKILEQLIDVAKGIRDRFYRERALSYIAASMADVGLFEQAIKIATSIKESYIRSSAFSSISVAMAKFGHKEAELFVKKALEAAKKVRGEIIVDGAVFIDRHSMALMDFSEDASKGGFFNYALEAVKEIESEEFKSWGIYYIAVWAARSGKQEYKPLLYQLLEMSQAIQEARYSVLALSAIAAAFQKIGEQNEANSLFERAIKLANEVTDKFDRSRTWRNIARAMAFAGMYDKAIDFAKQAEFFSSAAFRIICSEMVRDGLLEQAYQIAKDISNIEERSAALHNVAIAMIKAGKIEKAAGIAREMSKTLRKHPKSIRLAVMIMAEAGNWGEALELTKDIQDVQEYLRALAHIVKAMKTAKMFKGS